MKNLRKTLSVILLAFVLVVGASAVGCNDQAAAPESAKLALSETSCIMYVFDNKTITLESDSDKSVTWTCTDGDVLELIPNGKTVTLKAIRRGEVSVIAKQGNNSVSCIVNVFPTYKKFDVTLESSATAQLKIGDTYSLAAVATLDGEECSNVTFEYTLIQSSPAGSVSVDGNGLVTALAQGTALVGVRAVYGDTYTGWATVTVYVFPTDYDNEDQKQPTLEDGGYIEDIFDTEEIIPELPDGGFIEDVFGE